MSNLQALTVGDYLYVYNCFLRCWCFSTIIEENATQFKIHKYGYNHDSDKWINKNNTDMLSSINEHDILPQILQSLSLPGFYVSYRSAIANKQFIIITDDKANIHKYNIKTNEWSMVNVNINTDILQKIITKSTLYLLCEHYRCANDFTTFKTIDIHCFDLNTNRLNIYNKTTSIFFFFLNLFVLLQY